MITIIIHEFDRHFQYQTGFDKIEHDKSEF